MVQYMVNTVLQYHLLYSVYMDICLTQYTIHIEHYDFANVSKGIKIRPSIPFSMKQETYGRSEHGAPVKQVSI